MLTIEHIFVSSGHSFVGRHGQAPADHPMQEVDEVECVAGRGLRGDRYFDHREDYKGQVTLVSAEVFAGLCEALKVNGVSPSAMRRNVVVRGGDLNELIGKEFELQGVKLAGTEECRPCGWMDSAVTGGAQEWLRGRGGLRCRILSDGWLRRDGA